MIDEADDFGLKSKHLNDKRRDEDGNEHNIEHEEGNSIVAKPMFDHGEEQNMEKECNGDRFDEAKQSDRMVIRNNKDEGEEEYYNCAKEEIKDGQITINKFESNGKPVALNQYLLKIKVLKDATASKHGSKYEKTIEGNGHILLVLDPEALVSTSWKFSKHNRPLGKTLEDDEVIYYLHEVGIFITNLIMENGLNVALWTRLSNKQTRHILEVMKMDIASFIFTWIQSQNCEIKDRRRLGSKYHSCIQKNFKVIKENIIIKGNNNFDNIIILEPYTRFYPNGLKLSPTSVRLDNTNEKERCIVMPLFKDLQRALEWLSSFLGPFLVEIN